MIKRNIRQEAARDKELVGLIEAQLGRLHITRIEAGRYIGVSHVTFAKRLKNPNLFTRMDLRRLAEHLEIPLEEMQKWAV